MTTQETSSGLTIPSSHNIQALGRTTSKYRFGETNTIGRDVGAVKDAQAKLGHYHSDLHEYDQTHLRSELPHQAEAVQGAITETEARKIKIKATHLALYEEVSQDVREELRDLFTKELKAEVWCEAENVKLEMRDQLTKELTPEVKAVLSKKLRTEAQVHFPSLYAEELASYRNETRARVEREYPPLLRAELKTKLEPELAKEVAKDLTKKLTKELKKELKQELKLKFIEELREDVRDSMTQLLIQELKDELREKMRRKDMNQRLKAKSPENHKSNDPNFDSDSHEISPDQGKVRSWQRTLETEVPHAENEPKIKVEQQSEVDGEEGQYGVRAEVGGDSGMNHGRPADDAHNNNGHRERAVGNPNEGAAGVPEQTQTGQASNATLRGWFVKALNRQALQQRSAKRHRSEFDADEEDVKYPASKHFKQDVRGEKFSRDSGASGDNVGVKNETHSHDGQIAFEDDSRVNVGIKVYHPSQSGESAADYNEEGEYNTNTGNKAVDPLYNPHADEIMDESKYGAYSGAYDESEESYESDENAGAGIPNIAPTSQSSNLLGSTKENAIDLSESDDEEVTELPSTTPINWFSAANRGPSHNHSSNDNTHTHNPKLHPHGIDSRVAHANSPVGKAFNDLPDYDSDPEAFQQNASVDKENLAHAKAAALQAQSLLNRGYDEDYDGDHDEDEDTLIEEVGATAAVAKTIKEEDDYYHQTSPAIKLEEEEEEEL